MADLLTFYNPIGDISGHDIVWKSTWLRAARTLITPEANGWSIEYLKIKCTAFGTIQNILAKLTDISGSAPGSTVHGSVVVNVSSVDGWPNGEWVTITFSSAITIPKNTQFAFVIEPNEQWGSFNSLRLWQDSGETPAGQAFYSSGTPPDWGNWTSTTKWPLFEVWGTLAAPGKAQNPTPADDVDDIKIVGAEMLSKLIWEAPS